MRHRPRHIDGLQELVVSMPETAQTRLSESTRGLPGHAELAALAVHGEWVRPEVARRISQQLADEVRSRFPSAALYDDDPMTPRILREALFSARGSHRHLASLALLGSPFRAELADVLAGHLDVADLDDSVAERLMRLLRYLVGPSQERMLVTWIDKGEPARLCDIAVALGQLHASTVDLAPLVEHLGRQPALDRAILYCLGMREDDALVGLAKDDSRPSSIRDGAAWWLRQGGAVLE
jgi:hypothetical protein